MKIAVDIDDVLAEFIPALADWHNVVYGTNLSKKDFHTFHFNEIWGGTIQEAIQKVKDFFREKGVLNMAVVNDAVFGVNSLCKKHDLYAITSRFSFLISVTNEWINNNFKGCFKDVLFGHNKYSKEDKSLSKAEQCELLGVNILIDDLPEHALECSEKGIRALLFDAPWNKNVKESEMIKRVGNWEEVLREINLLSI